MTYQNKIEPAYKEKKQQAKISFVAAYEFLTQIENLLQQKIYISTYKNLHLYFKNNFLFRLEFIISKATGVVKAVNISPKYNNIKKEVSDNSEYFFRYLLNQIQHTDIINDTNIEITKNPHFEILINNSKNAKIIFELIIKTLKHIATDTSLTVEFWKNEKFNDHSLEHNIIEVQFIEDIRKAKKVSKSERRKKIKLSNPKPEKIIVKQIAFKRNPYVVLEVLERANGKCEKCGKKAPFLRDTDNSPYLEIHHKIPLAENGDDTVENSIGLCPNCHRKAHHGKNTY